MSPRLPIAGMLFFVFWVPSQTALGQSETKIKRKVENPAKLETEVEFELYAPREGVFRYAQTWSEAFQGMDLAFEIRTQLVGDKPGVSEEILGNRFRKVTVKGRIERDGSLTLGDQNFKGNELEELKEWIDGLKLYGAKGSPDQQPFWGIGEPAYLELKKSLAEPVQDETSGKTFDEALRAVIHSDHPPRLTPQAKTTIAGIQEGTTVRDELRGVSKGTALAIVLHQFGLGFRPQRLQNGDMEIVILPESAEQKLWPLGEPLKGAPRDRIPKLFETQRISVRSEPLADVLITLSELAEVPILFDQPKLDLKGIDPASKKVDYPRKQMIWSGALKTLLFQAKLEREYREDDSGNPFIWVKPFGSTEMVR